MRPAFVLSRKTFEGELFLHGFTAEKVEIYSQTKVYIDSDSVADWFREPFIPVLAARREQYRFFGPRYCSSITAQRIAGQNSSISAENTGSL
jgi:hypothetical protein